jgi:hypothetical protein
MLHNAYHLWWVPPLSLLHFSSPLSTSFPWWRGSKAATLSISLATELSRVAATRPKRRRRQLGSTSPPLTSGGAWRGSGGRRGRWLGSRGQRELGGRRRRRPPYPPQPVPLSFSPLSTPLTLLHAPLSSSLSLSPQRI